MAQAAEPGTAPEAADAGSSAQADDPATAKASEPAVEGARAEAETTGTEAGEPDPLRAADAAYVAGFGTAVKAGVAPPEPPARRPRRSDAHLGVDLALRTLVVPDHGDAFWDDMAQRVADEPQLRLRPRAAVRPITQPPPVVEDHLIFDDSTLAGRRATSRRRRRLLVAVLAIVAALFAIGIVQDSRDGTETGGGRATTTTTTTAPATTPAPAPGTAPPGTPPPLEPNAQLTPNAVGRLPIPATARDLTTSGFVLQVDQRTFDASGGTCYDARVAGVPDLLLRFRSPDRNVGVTDQGAGVLASVTVDAGVGSPRTTQSGIGIGTPEAQVRAIYPEALDDLAHPFVPGGHILRVANADGSGNGMAFYTDGFTVTAISVGQYDVIAVPDGCV